MALELLRKGLSLAGGLPGGRTLASAAGQAAHLGVRVAAPPARRTGRVLHGVYGLVEGVTGSGRAVRRYPGRLHIELRHLHKVGMRDAAQALAEAAEGHDGVRWARVNGALGTLIVEFAGDEPPVAVLDLVEALDRPSPREGGEPEPGPPPVALALGADLLGLAITGAEWVLGRAPLPAEVAGLVAFADNVPRLREALGRAVPGVPMRRWLPLTDALSQALAPGGAGLAVDMALRVWERREERACARLWEDAEEDLAGTPVRAASQAIVTERPRDLPAGPVERYEDQAVPLGLGGVALGGLMTGGVRRALDVGLAAMPRAPAVAREVFAAELGARLAHRGVLILDPAALRRLDRVDTVVLDARVLLTGELGVGEVVAAGGASDAEVAGRVHALFGAAALKQVTEDDGWSLGPARRLVPGEDVPEEARRLGGDRPLLALTEDGRPRAFLTAVRRPVDGANALFVAARESGARLVLAGPDVELPGRPDVRVPGGKRLVASVRRLQADGAGVLLVSGDPAALAAADVGVGADWDGDRPPWGAHVLVRDDLADAAHLIEAAAAGRRVAERGVTLARSGTGVGALLALTAPPGRAASRVLAAVNAAAAVGMAHGAWTARSVMRSVPAPALPSTPWHTMPAGAVLDRLESRVEGLSREEAAARRTAARGDDGPRWPFLIAFGQELANPLTAVLAAGAAGSAAVGSLADAGLVAAAMGLSGLVGGGQRVATDRTIARISARSAESVRVLRDGAETVVEAGRLVRGDVFALAAGDAIPADCRILTARGLEADESSLTGESLPVAKHPAPTLARHVADRHCMLYEGTMIAAGECTAVVVALGEATESGRAMAASGGASPAGGVEDRLKQVTDATTPMAIAAAVGVVTSGLLRGGALRTALSEGVNLAVASVPEGLPLLVSAAQLAATRRLAERGVFVRDPRTIETLGRVEVLCFDKTGTLTEGEIRLARVADHAHDAGAAHLDGTLRRVLAAALRATPEPGNGLRHSHVTDAAVDEGAAQAGVGRDAGEPWEQLTSLPFEPSRAFHAALGRAGDRVKVCVKGAPEVVLPRCSRMPEDDLDGAARRAVEERVERMAAAGHRVLAVAERVTDEDRAARGGDLDEDEVTGLTYLGLLGLADVVRDTAAPAVAALRDAGVQIIMLTGDHPATAEAIAADVAGEGTEHRVITADEIDHLDDDLLAEALTGVDVVARCTPLHKVRVVRAFRGLGRTVAMTGDGANDAAGIRLADVGIALGVRGTAAARSAADLVVADDRLETIVGALVEGRAMWVAVREALAILVGGNLGEIGFILLGSLVTGRSPLSARQMLLMNMLTDLAPALAVAVRVPSEETTEELLREGPESSLGSALTHRIAHRAVVTALGAGIGFTAGRLTGPAARARTIGLVALIGTQLAQTLRAGRNDRAILVSAVGSAVVLGAIVQTPVVSAFFGCVPLDPLAWATAVGAIAAAVVAGRLVLEGKRTQNGPR